MKISFFRVIIKAFETIAHSNTLLNNQRYIYSEKLHNIVMKTQRIYQNLICCVMKFEIAFLNTAILAFKNGFAKSFHDEKNFQNEKSFQNEKNFHGYDRKGFHDEKDFHDHNGKGFSNRETEQSLTEMLFETTNINFDFDSEFSSIAFNFHSTRFTIKKRARQFQRNKFQFLLNLFNVHLSLHIVDMTRKFDTIMNMNVFSKKIKHM